MYQLLALSCLAALPQEDAPRPAEPFAELHGPTYSLRFEPGSAERGGLDGGDLLQLLEELTATPITVDEPTRAKLARRRPDFLTPVELHTERPQEVLYALLGLSGVHFDRDQDSE